MNFIGKTRPFLRIKLRTVKGQKELLVELRKPQKLKTLSNLLFDNLLEMFALRNVYFIFIGVIIIIGITTIV